MRFEALHQPFSVAEGKKRKWLWLAITALYLTYFLRGFRPAWTYGYFNYTNNWMHGFIPRGLWGTIVRLMFGNRVPSAQTLALLQQIMGFLFAVYICLVLYRLICQDGNLTALLLLTIFSVSTFNMFYLTEIGFLDHVVYLLVILHIEISLHRSWKMCLLSGALLSMIFPWIVETSAFLMCPIVASICAIRMMEEKEFNWGGVLGRLILAFLPTLVGIVAYRGLESNLNAIDMLAQEMQGQPYFDIGYQNYLGDFSDINLLNITPQCWMYIPPEIIVYAAVIIGLLGLFLMYTGCSVRVMLTAVLLLIAASFISYLAIYFGADYHRYYFAIVQTPMLISIFILQRYRTEHLNRLQGIVAVLVCLVIILPVSDYRLWNFNQIYKDFWFNILLKKLGITL